MLEPSDVSTVPLANCGILLQPAPQGLLVTPKRRPADVDVPPPAFLLPMFPSMRLEQIAGTARAFYRRYQRSVTFLFYLHIETHHWEVHVPSQMAAATDGRINLSFAGIPAPHEHLRLAGSIRSIPRVGFDDAHSVTPCFDGAHLLMDPCQDWISLRSFCRCAGELHPFALDQLINDECDLFLPSLSGRVWLIDHL